MAEALPTAEAEAVVREEAIAQRERERERESVIHFEKIKETELRERLSAWFNMSC